MPVLSRLLLALLLAFAATPAAAFGAMGPGGNERILSFVSDVRIQRDGTLDVTETIRLTVAGEEIKRGINRDFPTRYRNPAGQTTSTTFDLVSVRRDGIDEPYTLIPQSNGMRVRIGRAEVLLAHGEHSYEIRYRTKRQLIFGREKDELYWNATGTGWTFPIDMAEARITLPQPAAFGERAVYTGAQGATTRDAAVVAERPGYIAFRTTAPLSAQAGLTVAAAFPKGLVDPPSDAEQARWWLQDWGALAASFVALLGLGGYYFWAWLRAGKGPARGTIVPLFSPPDGLSAAAMRYVEKMRIDNRAFTAAVVQMGVARHLRIEKAEGGWLSSDVTTLHRTSDNGDAPLPERAMLDTLFGSGNAIALKQDNHATLQAARTALAEGLQAAFGEQLFRSNSGWAGYGLLAIPLAFQFVALIAIATRVPAAPGWLLAVPLVGAGALIAAVWLIGAARNLRGVGKGLLWTGAVLGIGLGIAAAGVAVVAALSDGIWPVLLPLLALPLAISAFVWMHAPTREGRAVLDRIAGFKQYLGIAEEHRLESMHPPEKTPELFERYLPYAIALGVENRWADRFAGVLAAAAAAGTTGTAMGWYAGGGNAWSDPGGFASDLGGSLNSTIASASTSPSSSDGGSSGGGSSGGGGGGGGGSGW